jgi:hypothetical protein
MLLTVLTGNSCCQQACMIGRKIRNYKQQPGTRVSEALQKANRRCLALDGVALPVGISTNI